MSVVMLTSLDFSRGQYGIGETPCPPPQMEPLVIALVTTYK